MEQEARSKLKLGIFVVAVLGRASADCPVGWSPGPASKCYRVTDEQTTHWGCATLCDDGASLACMGSAEEDEFARAMAEAAGAYRVWHGLYQAPGSAEPAGGWDHCSSGELATYANWGPGEPNDPGSGYACAAMRQEGQWHWGDYQCATFFPCICELGNSTSAEYSIAINEVTQLAPLRMQAARIFGVYVPFSWLLPALILYLCSIRSARGRRSSTVAAAPPPETGDRRLSDASSAASLAAAERAGKRQRLRVSGTVAQAGWMLGVVGLAPFLGYNSIFDVDLTPVAGNFVYYTPAIPWGGALLLLALRPTDETPVGIACIFFFVFFLFFALLFAYLPTHPQHAGEGNPINIATHEACALLFLLCTALLWPTLKGTRCRPRAAEPMPPRRQLHRLWFVYRLVLFGLAVACMFFYFAPLHVGGHVALTWRRDDYQAAQLLTCVSFLAAALVFTPATRGRILCWLGTLGGKHGSTQQEAAAVASLIGKSSAADALAAATRTFRVLPLDQLAESDLASNQDTGLHERTVPARLGECSAFLSHSWSDDGVAKYAALHEWAEEAKIASPRIWLDKACIDQTNIDASLAALPIFVSACRVLLIIAGPTYSTRLWCAMEIFTFVKMGGSRERITLKQISADAIDALSHFDASRAQCFHAKDRHKLLAVIEVGFGNLTPFNKLVRRLLTSDHKLVRRLLTSDHKLVRRLLTSDQGAETPKGSLATTSTTSTTSKGVAGMRSRQGDHVVAVARRA